MERRGAVPEDELQLLDALERLAGVVTGHGHTDAAADGGGAPRCCGTVRLYQWQLAEGRLCYYDARTLVDGGAGGRRACLRGGEPSVPPVGQEVTAVVDRRRLQAADGHVYCYGLILADTNARIGPADCIQHGYVRPATAAGPPLGIALLARRYGEHAAGTPVVYEDAAVGRRRFAAELGGRVVEKGEGKRQFLLEPARESIGVEGGSLASANLHRGEPLRCDMLRPTAGLRRAPALWHAFRDCPTALFAASVERLRADRAEGVAVVAARTAQSESGGGGDWLCLADVDRRNMIVCDASLTPPPASLEPGARLAFAAAADFEWSPFRWRCVKLEQLDGDGADGGGVQEPLPAELLAECEAALRDYRAACTVDSPANDVAAVDRPPTVEPVKSSRLRHRRPAAVSSAATGSRPADADAAAGAAEPIRSRLRHRKPAAVAAGASPPPVAAAAASEAGGDEPDLIDLTAPETTSATAAAAAVDEGARPATAEAARPSDSHAAATALSAYFRPPVSAAALAAFAALCSSEAGDLLLQVVFGVGDG